MSIGGRRNRVDVVFSGGGSNWPLRSRINTFGPSSRLDSNRPQSKSALWLLLHNRMLVRYDSLKLDVVIARCPPHAITRNQPNRFSRMSLNSVYSRGQWRYRRLAGAGYPRCTMQILSNTASTGFCSQNIIGGENRGNILPDPLAIGLHFHCGKSCCRSGLRLRECRGLLRCATMNRILHFGHWHLILCHDDRHTACRR